MRMNKRRPPERKNTKTTTNFEAAPEEHTLTPFLDVTLFKVPSSLWFRVSV